MQREYPLFMRQDCVNAPIFWAAVKALDSPKHLESLVEDHRLSARSEALLVLRHPLLEEVRQRLDILKHHERERIARVVALLITELYEALVRAVQQVFLHHLGRHAADTEG